MVAKLKLHTSDHRNTAMRQVDKVGRVLHGPIKSRIACHVRSTPTYVCRQTTEILGISFRVFAEKCTE